MSGARRGRLMPAPAAARSPAESAVIVQAEGPVKVDLDLGAVGLGDRDLVAVAGHVGGHGAGLAAADGLDRRRLRLGGVGARNRLLQRLVRRRAVRRERRPCLLTGGAALRAATG